MFGAMTIPDFASTYGVNVANVFAEQGFKNIILMSRDVEPYIELFVCFASGGMG